jgi:hypothetical protein
MLAGPLLTSVMTEVNGFRTGHRNCSNGRLPWALSRILVHQAVP